MSSIPEMIPSGTRQRLEHVDAMRPIKQTAVISTHALIFFSPLSTSLWASGILTLTHFSRDAFLFVSACMLAYSYRDRDSVQLRPYWKRRFMSVGLPYLIWTIIYFPIASMTKSTTFPYYRLPLPSMFSVAGAHRFLVELTTGYYHLYFLLVLIEFYVVFPFLYRFIRRFPQWHVGIIVGAVLWQLAYPYAVVHGWFGFNMPSKVETRLFISYPLYLIGGVVMALYLQQFHAWVVRHRRAILGWTVVFAVVPLTLEYLYRHGVNVPKYLVPGGDPFSSMMVPFDVGAIMAVYLLGVHLVSPLRSERTRAIVHSGSEAAYGIYLSQIVWILFLHRWTLEWGILAHVPWLVAALFAVTFAYLVGWLFSALFARTPLSHALVGRSRMSWSTFFPRKSRGASDGDSDIGEGPLNLTYE
jgi:peptidoglycan/LPS O-acetylase OafA/YrhL